MPSSILLIDDKAILRQLMARILSLEEFKVIEADTAKSGLRMLQQTEVHVVICDVKLPDANGIELTAQIKQAYPTIEIIVLTAYGTIADGVTAMKNGAFDYIIKGDDNNKLIPLVYRAMEKAHLQSRIKQLEDQVQQRYSFDNITGQSKAIRQAIELARKVAPTETTVLLTGETGSGKEVFAQAIHQASSRRLRPFIAINCGALSKEILESELFGHRAGAFTGATRDQKGLFAEAHKGTLFLDEIGEMPFDLQAKLLRVLETREFTRVGDTKPTQADVRIVAATNRNLERDASQGLFRLDLFYRLSVFTIELPTLNARLDDIPLLADQFARSSAAKLGKKPMTLSTTFLDALKRYTWRGNVRELKNVIERTVILNDGQTLLPELLPLDVQVAVENTTNPTLDLATVEKKHIAQILQYTHGNKAETARLLGIGLSTLYRKIEQYSLVIG